MKTLDITKTHEGIVVLTGFGGKHWETGYYLNGKLYAEGREGLEDAEALAKLCKKLAKDAGCSWSERLTHIWWRLESYSDIPKTLSAYDAKTVKAYQTQGEEALEEVVGSFTSRESDEKYRVSKAYELGGGAEDKFEAWYAEYLTQMGSFNRMHDEKMARYLRLSRDTATDVFTQAQAELADLWRSYLFDVYRANKPLDPVAKRAFREMRNQA